MLVICKLPKKLFTLCAAAYLHLAANPQPSSSPAPVYTHAIKAASERLQRGTGYHAPARQVLLAGYRAADVQVRMQACLVDDPPSALGILHVICMYVYVYVQGPLQGWDVR